MLLAAGDDVLPVSSLAKPLWPGRGGQAITKRDLLRYLTRVSPHLLPHLEGRPVFATRFPEGVGGESFYQKVWSDPPPFVRTLPIWSKEHGAPRDYLLVENLPTLLWLGQLAALELHVWLSRVTQAPDGHRLGTR